MGWTSVWIFSTSITHQTSEQLASSVKDAIRLLSGREGGKLLQVDDCVTTSSGSSTVFAALKDKHPSGQPSSTCSIISLDNPPKVHQFYSRGERSHNISLLCKICEDVDDLYKWQTFRPGGLHQRKISHADNNTTIIHDIHVVFIDIIKSNCSIISKGWGFVLLEKASQDHRFFNSSSTARRSSTTLSICSPWSSSRWHHPSSLCRWSWPINRPGNLSVMIIDKCWKDDAILRKIRESRWIRSLKPPCRRGWI